MAANDEFPRGWDVFSSPAPPGMASITLPAIPGVSHVLTAVNAAAACNSPAAVQFAQFVAVSGGIAVTFGYVVLSAGVAVAGTFAGDSTLQWSGKLVAPPNNAITVAFSSGQANVFEVLEIQGYDI